MFGTTVDVIRKDWQFVARIKCKGVPRNGEYIYVSDMEKYVVVSAVIHEGGFWRGKVTVVVEDVTVNSPTNDKESEE